MKITGNIVYVSKEEQKFFAWLMEMCGQAEKKFGPEFAFGYFNGAIGLKYSSNPLSRDEVIDLCRLYMAGNPIVFRVDHSSN